MGSLGLLILGLWVSLSRSKWRTAAAPGRAPAECCLNALAGSALLPQPEESFFHTYFTSAHLSQI